MRIFTFFFTLIFCYDTLSAQDKMNAFVANLMSKMTVDEKIGQLNLVTPGGAVTGSVVSSDVDNKIRKGQVGGLFGITGPDKIRQAQDIAVKSSRLKIPLIFGLDVIHGHRTIFPIPLGISCSWDTAMIRRSASIAASEATADGLNWVYSPMVDIARDPRWGRIAEGSGEDPFLGSQIAKVMVKGYQGNDLAAKNTVMACVKHFALYGSSNNPNLYFASRTFRHALSICACVIFPSCSDFLSVFRYPSLTMSISSPAFIASADTFCRSPNPCAIISLTEV